MLRKIKIHFDEYFLITISNQLALTFKFYFGEQKKKHFEQKQIKNVGENFIGRLIISIKIAVDKKVAFCSDSDEQKTKQHLSSRHLDKTKSWFADA